MQVVKNLPELRIKTLIAAYQPPALATIQQLDPIYVDVRQSTSELLRLRRNVNHGRLNQNNGSQNKVELILEDGTTYPLEGTLQFRDITVDMQLSAQQSLVDAAAVTYRLSITLYAKGIDSYLGVLDAQRSLYGAEQGLIAIRLARLANQVRLYAVLGGGGG